MVTDSVKHALRVIPASLALAQLNVDAPTRKAYLAANGPQRRKGTAAVLGRYVSDVVFRSVVLRVAEAQAGCRDVGVPLLVAVAGDRLGLPLPRRAVLVRLPRRGGRRRARGRRPAAGAGRGAARIRRVVRARRRSGLAGLVGGPGTTRVFGGAASRPDVTAGGYESVRPLRLTVGRSGRARG